MKIAYRIITFFIAIVEMQKGYICKRQKRKIGEQVQTLQMLPCK